MNKLRQSFRRKKDVYVPESSRPHQWQTDEEAVRSGKCSFTVKYLGHVEVEESRGMHICEEAVKRLKTDRKFFKGFFAKAGKKAVRAVLWVSADGLRVVDDKTKAGSPKAKTDLILDQTIEKVSFCAPDRNFERAFSYICRDGTTRRWICHCFLAVKDSGERLSHAVGCAFAACLERKQKREKECGVTATFDANRTTFTREGSFRVTTATEAAEREEVMRQLQEAKKAEAAPPPPSSASSGNGSSGPPSDSPGSSPPLSAATLGPQSIPRRHAPADALARQGSFRGFPGLSQNNSPFKRQMSLRIGNELPGGGPPRKDFPLKNSVVEVEGEADSISSLCSQITTAFSGGPGDPFASAPMPKPTSSPQSPVAPVNGSSPAYPPALPPPLPARDTNPWARLPAGLHSAPGSDWSTSATGAALGGSSPALPSHRRTPSEADRWLEEVTKSVRVPPQPAAPLLGPPAGQHPGAAAPPPPPMGFLPPPMPMLPPRQPAYPAQPAAAYPVSNGLAFGPPSVPVVGITPSQMVANVFGSAAQPPPPSIAPHPHPHPQMLPQPFPVPHYGHGHAHAHSHALAAAHYSKPLLLPPVLSPAPLLQPSSNGSAAFNGGAAGENWATAAASHQLPSLAPPSPALAPPQTSLAPPPPAGQVDAFEAQWVALEGRSRQHASPSPTNPFSSELHQTFEIQL
ncbi:unnamed protein product [Arctogadus glacialis]